MNTPEVGLTSKSYSPKSLSVIEKNLKQLINYKKGDYLVVKKKGNRYYIVPDNRWFGYPSEQEVNAVITLIDKTFLAAMKNQGERELQLVKKAFPRLHDYKERYKDNVVLRNIIDTIMNKYRKILNGEKDRTIEALDLANCNEQKKRHSLDASKFTHKKKKKSSEKEKPCSEKELSGESPFLKEIKIVKLHPIYTDEDPESLDKEWKRELAAARKDITKVVRPQLVSLEVNGRMFRSDPNPLRNDAIWSSLRNQVDKTCKEKHLGRQKSPREDDTCWGSEEDETYPTTSIPKINIINELLRNQKFIRRKSAMEKSIEISYEEK